MTDTRTFNRTESATPRNPSNRSVITQMERWGWRIVKTGKYVDMRAPIGTETVGVQAANKHDANATSVLLTIYRLTTQSDADLFWRGPSKLWTDMIEAKRAEEQAARRSSMVLPPAPKVTPVAVPAPPPKNPSPNQRSGWAWAYNNEGETVAETLTHAPRKNSPPMATSRQVIAELSAAAPRALDAETICRRLGLDPTDEPQRRCISNILSSLYRAGQIRRMRLGHYRTLAVATSGDAVVVPKPVTPQPAPPAAPSVAVIQNDAVFAARRPNESVDDVIEAVLDLLLPQGFQAKDLRVISPWIEATKLMVGTVTR